MIDEKRIAEIRANAATCSTVEYAELLELIECYKAARAYANAERTYDSELCSIESVEAANKAVDAALHNLVALFPEATNG